jgi:recombination associated protein RdgC
MWFKNLCVFRFTGSFELQPEDMVSRLADQAFRPVGRMEPSSTGWVPPLGIPESPLVHVANGYALLCARREERILPAAAVSEVLEARIDEIEEKTGRRVRGKARSDLREEVVLEMLPRAFTRSRRTFAYVDPREGWLVIDAPSAGRAEEVTGLLRESLGSLPVAPFSVTGSPTGIMTAWLASASPPEGFTMGDECDLGEPGDDGGVIRVRRHDLEAAEIRAHLEAGKRVTRLAIGFDERLSCLVDENLLIKRLKFLDLVQDEAAGVHADTDAERFDSDFAIMSLELARFLPRLAEAFGGLAGKDSQRDAA